jgi:hypothetical protein
MDADLGNPRDHFPKAKPRNLLRQGVQESYGAWLMKRFGIVGSRVAAAKQVPHPLARRAVSGFGMVVSWG